MVRVRVRVRVMVRVRVRVRARARLRILAEAVVRREGGHADGHVPKVRGCSADGKRV